MKNLSFDDLRGLLRLSANEPSVVNVTGVKASELKRYEHVAGVALKSAGISVNFKEAPWVVPEGNGLPADELVVRGIHFFSGGYEGYEAFTSALPGNVNFGDDEPTVVAKLGVPEKTGGGSYSALLRKPIPRWLRYCLSADIFQLHLDDKGQVNLATLFVQDRQSPI